jgi:hypothetical protein
MRKLLLVLNSALKSDRNYARTQGDTLHLTIRMKPTPKGFARHGRHGDQDRQAEQAGPLDEIQGVGGKHAEVGSPRATASLVRFPSWRSRTPAVMLFNATRGLSFSRRPHAQGE